MGYDVSLLRAPVNSLLIILLYSGLIAVSVFISVKIVRGDPRRLPVAYALTAVLFGIGFVIDRMFITGS